MHVPQECVPLQRKALVLRTLTCAVRFAALEFEDPPDYDRLRGMLLTGIVDAAAFDLEVRAIA